MSDPSDKAINKELIARGEVPIDFKGVGNFIGYHQQSQEKIQKKSNFSVIRGKV